MGAISEPDAEKLLSNVKWIASLDTRESRVAKAGATGVRRQAAPTMMAVTVVAVLAQVTLEEVPMQIAGGTR